jgi:hypothetical protein
MVGMQKRRLDLKMGVARQLKTTTSEEFGGASHIEALRSAGLVILRVGTVLPPNVIDQSSN